MTAATVTIWWSHQRIDVPAWPTPVPGLVIHAGLAPQVGTWAVTHAASGAGILRMADPEGALHAAIRLGDLADWLQPGSALRDRPGLAARVRLLAHELNCYEMTYGTGAVISDSELAMTESVPS